MQPKVLVLDAETRSALAVIRSLGKRGYSVAAASSDERAIGFKSRYTEYVFLTPSPITAPETFLKWLGMILDDWEPNIVLPVSDVSMLLCLRNAHLISRKAVLPTPAKAVFEAVFDKANLMELAEQVGLRVPKTIALPEFERWTSETEAQIREVSYPAVLKPRCSAFDLGARVAQGPMFYVNSPEDVHARLSEAYQKIGRIAPYILQQKIVGSGVGVFSLCVSGMSVIEFCHRRILEKPPSGGRSVLSESIPLDQAPYKESFELLKRLNWQGVAMLEFKQTADGTCYLMEINPRFWGSMQLAIDCGRDFPALLCELSIRENQDPVAIRRDWADRFGPYKEGRRLRWLLGTVDHVLIRLKQGFFSTLRDIFAGDALHVWRKRKPTRLEVCRIDDIRPFIRECKNYLLELLGY